MTSPITLLPVGVVRSPVKELREGDFGGVMAKIELDATRFTTESLQGLAEFSHVEIFFLLHELTESEIVHGSRHPRNRQDWPKVGIFAQRAKNRPSRIGATVCRLVGLEGLTIAVEELDAIDGTPVLDVKPWMSVMGPRGEAREPAWARELAAVYWKPAK